MEEVKKSDRQGTPAGIEGVILLSRALTQNFDFCNSLKLFVLKNKILWNKILINKTISFYENI